MGSMPMRGVLKTIEVADIDLKKGGGAYRTYKMLMARSSTDVECRSILMSFTRDTFRDIQGTCPPQGIAYVKRLLAIASKGFLSITLRSLPSRLSLDIRLRKPVNDADVVVCHMGDIICMKIALEISKQMGSKSVTILQLPPFFNDSKRISGIVDSLFLFQKLQTMAESSLKDLLNSSYGVMDTLFLKSAMRYLTPPLLGGILRRFDLVLAVSRSIPVEMGWEDRVVAMDPGVGFDEEELNYMRSLRLKRPEKPWLYAVFPARPAPVKGLADLLIAVKIIARSKRDFKIAISASERDRIGLSIIKIAKKLGILDNIVLTGYIPQRGDLLSFRAGARLSLYPSHMDSYSYAVAESLLLGTPVVAYDIPALRINYGNLNGVYLVKEGDIEALAQKALEILDAKNIDVEEPRVKLFSEIAVEEKKIMEKHLKI